jgi:hypothetical protein
MKKILRTITILTLIAAVFSVTAWVISLVQAHPGKLQTPAASSENRKRTLREVAQERDVETTADPEGEAEHTDLRALAESSRAIVLGRITKAESSFIESGEFIVTTYTLDVRRVFKDTTSEGAWRLLPEGVPPAPLATPLKFVRWGGVVEVNGHRASLKMKGYELLKEGRDYIFFLNWSSFIKAYDLAGGISGVVRVEDDLRVTPLASSEKVKRKHGGADLETFINEILNEQR